MALRKLSINTATAGKVAEALKRYTNESAVRQALALYTRDSLVYIRTHMFTFLPPNKRYVKQTAWNRKWYEDDIVRLWKHHRETQSKGGK